METKRMHEFKPNRDYHYNNFKFADKDDFDWIKKCLSDGYEPKMVMAYDFSEYDIVIFKDGRCMIVDDEDHFYRNEDAARKDDCDLTPSDLITTLYYEDFNNNKSGSISEIPSDTMLCTITLTDRAKEIYNKIEELKKELSISQYENKSEKTENMFLTQQEYEFLTT